MVSVALPSSIPVGHVLIRVAFAGVNASDVNFSAGRYQASIAEAQAALPFDAGFEAVGAVAALGPQVSGGSLLCYLCFFSKAQCCLYMQPAVMSFASAPHLHPTMTFSTTHNTRLCCWSLWANLAITTGAIVCQVPADRLGESVSWL